jgi:HEAT repeat protein
LWAELAHTDAQRAGAAMTALLQTPQQASSLFAHKLQPVSAVAPERVARAIADLDGNEFAVRERAARELEQLAELAEPAMRKALAGKPSLEGRRRIEALLDKLDHPSPEQLRRLRAVEILELLGTPEARKLLQRLADGAPKARLTQEAKASLERLAQRPTVR